ncbi:hypothetical protein LptCag_2640 [Leptospirillum ferriphilum]|jgi:hypothetical protein|uniref:Uncharacterized protein n=1 Tax=Leptospirillum ferriphilum TaxID=178606 RepID=A0A094YPM5_9BACT|nr:hypothetical protein [Leptospirillum ferriphilum]KGA95206.1 hypothetical protein LptCag_2640 [Leptospirillum ferriphilum]
MHAIALKPIRIKSTGQEFLPGQTLEAEAAKILQWSERGLVKILPDERIVSRWQSPLFGPLEAPLLEKGPTHFRLVHPLTGETVTLSNDWLVSLEERAAIIEFDGGFPREKAEAQANRDIFNLFRK